jgi:hypothetical protein
MTRAEVVNKLHEIIESAVIRAGGNSRLSFAREVHQIFETMGKLSPEPRVKPQVPAYNAKKVRRVGTLVERAQFTEEQREAARSALRAVGLL